MFQRIYISISKYLTLEDLKTENIPNEDLFEISINQKSSFQVLKSLACFLSPFASKQLQQGIFSLNVTLESSIPAYLIDQLKNLLSGHPIIVGPNDFQLYSRLFDSLGNSDFDQFFQQRRPPFRKRFFLSLSSLKSIPFQICEPNIEFGGTSLPKGLMKLFFCNTNNLFSSTDFQSEFLPQLFRGKIPKLDPNTQQFLLKIGIHEDLVDQLYEFSDPKFSQAALKVD